MLSYVSLKETTPISDRNDYPQLLFFNLYLFKGNPLTFSQIMISLVTYTTLHTFTPGSYLVQPQSDLSDTGGDRVKGLVQGWW